MIKDGVDAGAPPERAIDWDVVQHAVGVKVAVTIEESSRVLAVWTQHAIAGQLAVKKEKSRTLLPGGPQHDMDPHRGRP
jgi:hypothetical protein